MLHIFTKTSEIHTNQLKDKKKVFSLSFFFFFFLGGGGHTVIEDSVVWCYCH